MPFMPMPPAPVMVATGDYVYVLRGNALFQFSAKDLKLLNRAVLPEERPRPMAPGRPAGPGGGDRPVPERPE